MTKLNIQEIIWASLSLSDNEEERLVSETLIEKFYENGFVETKKVSQEKWKQTFKKFPKQDEAYLLRKDQLKELAPLLYRGPIRKPFDPDRLKDGLRPAVWLNEFYQQVLRFQTTLSLKEWQQVIDQQIKTQFFIKEYFHLNAGSKHFFQTLLKQKPSPLRLLEIWAQNKPKIDSDLKAEKPVSPKPTQKAKPQPIKDEFKAKPEEIEKMKKVEKIYYQDEAGKAGISDEEALGFLEELDELEDEEELK